MAGKTRSYRGWFNPKVTFREDIQEFLAKPNRKGKLRRCHLQHLVTGRVINVGSIATFCRKAKLKGNAKLHITPVLEGKRWSYKGWFKPDTLKQEVALADVYGNQYDPVKVQTLIEDHGLTVHGLKRILRGQFYGTRRLTRADTPVQGLLKPRDWRVAEYVFKKQRPNRRGAPEIHRGSCLTQLAKDLGLSHPGSLYPLLYGWRSKVSAAGKGTITLVDVQTERKVAVPELEVVAQ